MAKYPVSQLDRTFAALVDPTRRAILARLEREPGLSITEIARPLPGKLPAVMKHLDVLSDDGLMPGPKSGRRGSGPSSVSGPRVSTGLPILSKEKMDEQRKAQSDDHSAFEGAAGAG